jgi:hypothetical protein
MKPDHPFDKKRLDRRLLLAFGGMGLVATPTNVVAWLPPPPPAPLVAPTEYANMTIDGVNIGEAWLDMANWVQSQADITLRQALFLPEPIAGQPPRNAWGKPVVFVKRPGTYEHWYGALSMYEAENCPPNHDFRSENGISACSWNLRTFEPSTTVWFNARYNRTEIISQNGLAWMASHFNPRRASALVRASRRPGATARTPRWQSLGDVHAEVRANAGAIKLYTSTSCPQIQASMLKLDALAKDDERRRQVPPVRQQQQGPPPPYMFQPVLEHFVTSYISPLSMGAVQIVERDWAVDNYDGTGNLKDKRKGITNPSNPDLQLSFAFQMHADILLIKRSCIGETVLAPAITDRLHITPPSVSSPASP